MLIARFKMDFHFVLHDLHFYLFGLIPFTLLCFYSLHLILVFFLSGYFESFDLAISIRE